MSLLFRRRPERNPSKTEDIIAGTEARIALWGLPAVIGVGRLSDEVVDQVIKHLRENYFVTPQGKVLTRKGNYRRNAMFVISERPDR